MSGNKTDNGVHEVGTDDIRLTYQHDTPGQDVENYIKEQEKAFHEEKNRSKKHFSQVFGNPLQGYPHNEAFEVKEIKEAIEEASTMSVHKKNMPKAKPMLQKLARARGVPISFDKDGINVHFKGRDKDVQKLMKDIEKDKKLMKLMEFDFTHVNEKQEVFENEKGLKNKAEKSGISLGILKQVYNRGLAAYKTGHRPGATAPQWAMARVNSFITKGKGTWGKADSDLADKVRGSKK